MTTCFLETFAGRFGRVIVTTKDGDRNLIRREVFEELRILDGLIQNATITFDDQTYTYQDVCAKNHDGCFVNSLLDLDQVMDEVSFIQNVSTETIVQSRMCILV